MSSALSHFFFAVTLSFALTVQAYSQSRPPDFSTSELILQQQRERELREVMEQSPHVRMQEPMEDISPQNVRLPHSEQPCFIIQSIKFAGERAEQFQWALSAVDKDPSGQPDSAINRCIGSEGINVIMSRLQNAIIQKGYVTTRIVVAEQDLSTGDLELTLIPGYVHVVRWADDASATTSWRTALPMREGDLLNLRDLEQGLEVLKRIPTAEADIQIEPGADSGQSDLVITRKHRFPFRVNLSLDDGGSKNTG